MPVRRLTRGAAAIAALVTAASLFAAGCGEKDYDAASLVDDLNAAGAGLELGQPLSSTQGSTVIAVNLADGGDSGAEHTEGAIVVLDDSDAAAQEFGRCESAVDFVCFRAANAVLRFSGITPEEQARITGAVSSLETG